MGHRRSRSELRRLDPADPIQEPASRGDDVAATDPIRREAEFTGRGNGQVDHAVLIQGGGVSQSSLGIRDLDPSSRGLDRRGRQIPGQANGVGLVERGADQVFFQAPHEDVRVLDLLARGAADLVEPGVNDQDPGDIATLSAGGAQELDIDAESGAGADRPTDELLAGGLEVGARHEGHAGCHDAS